MQNVAVLTEDGPFAFFFLPHPGGFDSSRVPTPKNLPFKAKKMRCAQLDRRLIGYIIIPHTSRSYLKLPGYIAWVQNIEEKVEMLERFSDF